MVGAGEVLQGKCWEETDPVSVGPALPTAFLHVLVAHCSTFLLGWVGGNGGDQWSFSLWSELVASETSA